MTSILRSITFVLACFPILTSAAEDYTPGIYYNPQFGGVLNANGEIATVRTSYIAYPAPETGLDISLKQGNDLLSATKRKRTQIPFPGTYNSGSAVAFNSQGQVLIQLQDTINVHIVEYQLRGQIQQIITVIVMGGAIFKDGTLTQIPAGPTSRWFGLAEDGTAVGAKYVGESLDGYWVPIFYKNGVTSEIPMPDGSAYGYQVADNKVLQDNSAFATNISPDGKILCTGSVTPTGSYENLGAFSTLGAGAGGTGVVFLYDIASATSVEIAELSGHNGNRSKITAMDRNASGEIVASDQSWFSLNWPGNRTSPNCIIYLPSAKYGLPAGRNTLQPPSSSAFSVFRNASVYALTDSGQIFATDPFTSCVEYWDTGTFKSFATPPR